MQKVWEKWLPVLLHHPVQIQTCAVQYARCRTHLAEASWAKSYIGINYVIDLVGGEENAFKPMLFCKAYLGGNGQLAYEKHSQQYLELNKAVDFQYIPELDMIVWCFPNDPTLWQLQELVDAQQVAKHLPYAHLPFDNHAEIISIAIKVIRYRAEQCCLLRYDIDYGDSQTVAIYAKVFESDKSEQVFIRMQQCDDLLRTLSYRTAKPLHYSPEISTIWLEELVGVALAGLLP